MSDEQPPTELEAALATILGILADEPGRDIEPLLAEHPALADELRRRIQKLAAHGLIRANPAALPGEAPARSVLAALAQRYEFRATIGSGGMGQVLRVYDRDLERDVALKVLHQARVADERARQRLLVEARITGGLQHPSIVPVYDAGMSPTGELYFTMKLVEGRSLAELVQADDEESRRWLGTRVRERLQIVLRICEAVEYAHSRGVLHRDLKPANIMIGRFGEVQVMDWGIARLQGAEEPTEPGSPERPQSASHTRSGDVFGTPSYMAPEQARGEHVAVDERTDVFGIGAILYHLVSGNPPYWGGSLVEVLQRAMSGRTNDPLFRQAQQRRVPKEIVAAVARALAPEKAARYASVRDLAEDLRAFLDDRRGSAWKDTVPTHVAKLVRRHPRGSTALMASGALGLTLVLGGAHVRAAFERNEMLRLRDRLAVAEARENADRVQFQEALGLPAFVPGEGWDDWCRKYFEAEQAVMREFGLELSSTSSTERFVARALEWKQRDSDVFLRIVARLERFAWVLLKTDATCSWLFGQGKIVPSAFRKRDALHWREMGAILPEFVAMWPAVQEMLDALVPEGPAAELWHAEKTLWNGGTHSLDALIERAPLLDLRHRTDLAELLVLKEQWERAAAMLAGIVAEDSSLARAHELLARTYREWKQPDDWAVRVLDHRLDAALHDPTPKHLADVGMSYIQLGTRQEGERWLRKALAQAPGLMSGVAGELATGSARDLIVPLANECLAGDPGCHGALRSLANWHLERSEFAEALVYCDELAVRYPDYIAFKNAGDCYWNLAVREAESDRAMALYEKAALRYRETTQAKREATFSRQKLGICLMRLGRYEEGLDELESSFEARLTDIRTRPRTEDQRRANEHLHALQMRELVASFEEFETAEVPASLRERLDRLLAEVQEQAKAWE